MLKRSGQGLSSETGTIIQKCECIRVCLCVCVFVCVWNICSSLALFSLLYIAHPYHLCRTPKEHWDGVKNSTKTSSTISVKWTSPRCQGVRISSDPLPTVILLFFYRPCFSHGPAHSIHLPQGTRCRVAVQMFCVYHPPITSLPNSYTVNIYRGVSSLLLPQRKRVGRQYIESERDKRDKGPSRRAGYAVYTVYIYSHPGCCLQQLFPFSSVCKTNTQGTCWHARMH